MTRALWLLAYAALCAARFLVGWAIDHVEEQIKGEKPEEEPK